MLGNLFKKAAKVQNRDLLEAIVAGCVLVASGDGTFEKQERDKLAKLLTTNDNLSAFKPAEIRQLMTKYENAVDADFDVFKQKAMKELTDISDKMEQCEEVFLNMLAVAKADGEIEEPELTVLKQVAGMFGLDLKEYGLA